MTTTTTPAETRRPRGRPSYMAHFVIRTSRFEESVAWHKQFFDAHEVYSRDGLTFLTFDDEHHRLAIVRLPDLEDASDTAAGIDHVAFTMPDLGELIAAYERLRSAGVLPVWSINHGPTTSLYYRDPDGVKIELQVDNATLPGGARSFFATQAFARNPLGIEFDPDQLAERFHAGESEQALLARPDTRAPA